MSSSRALDYDLTKCCRQAAAGSSWAALLVAVNTKPKDIGELMRVIGGDEHSFDGACFDAIADAWAIYADALVHGADL